MQVAKWAAATIAAVALCQAQVPVMLSPVASPAVGQAGATSVNLTGTGFPAGTISPQTTIVELQPANGGPAVAAKVMAVTTIFGSTRRVTFLIPASLSATGPTQYVASVSGTTSTATTFASFNSASLLVLPGAIELPDASLTSVSPSGGLAGQTFLVTITGIATDFVQGSTQARFGAGISVGGSAAGGFGPVTVNSLTTATASLSIDATASVGVRDVTVTTGSKEVSLLSGFNVGAAPLPAISDFNPKSAPAGAQIVLTGSNLSPSPSITLAKQGGGTVAAQILSASATGITFTIPSTAATGTVAVTVGGATATSSAALTITPPPSFSISALPSPAQLIQGQSINLTVSLTGSNGFSQMATLSVSGVPSGITPAFSPLQITDGQSSSLTLTAPANQPTSSSDITISASATVNGNVVVHTAIVHVNVTAADTGNIVTVSTAQYNNQRTGANLNEKILTPANVDGIRKLGSYAVDGAVYAQPLIISNVSVSGASSVLVTATMHNSVYVFNAQAPGSPYIWTRNLGTPLTSHPGQADNFLYQGEMGCMATPVVDTAAGVIYALCANSSGLWKLYSFNLADGTDFHAPVTIAGSSNGIAFDPIRHMSRVALGLVNGVVNIAFCGWADQLPYQGWVFAYNASTLSQIGAWSVVDTEDGGAGIWLSAGGLASDGTSLFVSTGNGTFAAKNYGNAFVRLSQLLAPLDYATPADWMTINARDRDINAGRVFVTGNYVIGGGKDGRIFVLDKSGPSSMGGLEGSGGPPFHQVFEGQNGAIFGCTVFANNSMIVGAMNTTMKRYTWNGSTFNTSPAGIGADPYPNPGPACSYSSNGADTSTAIVWGVTPAASAFNFVQTGTLRAWDGNTLAEIYSSGTTPGEALGDYTKFAPPTVANGRVYVATHSNAVAVYGFPANP
ncbi:MAG: IPT/TIG domain-containing protein [Bryobacteraceae bacterium]